MDGMDGVLKKIKIGDCILFVKKYIYLCLRRKKMKIGDYILYAKTFHESGRKNIYPG
jgi:hypothetical protein